MGRNQKSKSLPRKRRKLFLLNNCMILKKFGNMGGIITIKAVRLELTAVKGGWNRTTGNSVEDYCFTIKLLP